jgi:starvation-inducible outer membrane lipoprotein
MARSFVIALTLLLAACSGMPVTIVNMSPCQVSEASYECQVERYRNIGGR